MKRNYIKPVMATCTTCIDAEMMAGSPFDIGVGGDKGGTWDADAKETETLTGEDLYRIFLGWD